MSIEDIVKGCKEGNRQSQEVLVQKFAPGLLAICYRYTSDYHQAQDALQESFLSIFKNLPTLKNNAAFAGWAKRIAVHACLEILRKNQKFIFIEMNLTPEDISVEIPDVYSHLAKEEMLELLRKLPKTLYLVFNLYVIEGYDHKEIAEILNITESTSRASLFKARQKLIHIIRTGEHDNLQNFTFKDKLSIHGL
ncbi:MAG: sigma-70 family RNA polymerase sigma factor [Saprospiraceae bacterium]|nr:sigma-70 family RNA polymerase sigma factor [Saprospiraceae bacterium]